ncbi:hypothetical protein [Cellulomonas sp. Marseille-Q8402]
MGTHDRGPHEAGTDDRDDAPRYGEPALGQLPGINDSPTGASFRDGPRSRPQPWRAMLLTAVPPLVLIGVLLLLATR